MARLILNDSVYEISIKVHLLAKEKPLGVHNHLDTLYPNRWIGSGNTEHWPGRSPDLNFLAFCI